MCRRLVRSRQWSTLPIPAEATLRRQHVLLAARSPAPLGAVKARDCDPELGLMLDGLPPIARQISIVGGAYALFLGFVGFVWWVAWRLSLSKVPILRDVFCSSDAPRPQSRRPSSDTLRTGSSKGSTAVGAASNV